jgi:hypothetical protein
MPNYVSPALVRTANDVDMFQPIDAVGDEIISGNVAIGGTLSVAGATSLGTPGAPASLDVTGALSAHEGISLDAGNLALTGSANLSINPGTLTVAGLSTFASTVNIGGNSVPGTLNVEGGAFISSLLANSFGMSYANVNNQGTNIAQLGSVVLGQTRIVWGTTIQTDTNPFQFYPQRVPANTVRNQTQVGLFTGQPEYISVLTDRGNDGGTVNSATYFNDVDGVTIRVETSGQTLDTNGLWFMLIGPAKL